MIQLLVEAVLAAITWSNHCLYDFIRLSYFCPLFFTRLIQFFEVCEHLFTLFRSTEFQLVWGLDFDWTSATPWIFSFSGILFYLLVFLGSLSCCMTQYLPSFSYRTHGVTFDPRILWYTEELMVDSMTARCSGPVVAKQVQIITPPPPCLTFDMRCFCWYAVFGFHQMWRCSL